MNDIVHHVCFQRQLQEVRGQMDTEMRNHQRTRDQLQASHKQVMDLKQQVCTLFELPHEKANNLHTVYAKTKAQISLAVTAKLISSVVFAAQLVQFLYFINSQFPASSHLQHLYSSVFVGPVQKPHCWFSHDAAHFNLTINYFTHQKAADKLHTSN